MASTMKELGIDRLSAEQRVALALEIWESLEVTRPSAGLTPEQRAEVARRDAELDANPEIALTWEQIRERGVEVVSRALDFHPAVRDEIDNAQAWYEQRRSGLGKEFLDEVEQVIAGITANPARYGFADGDIREGQMPRFPYVVYYRALADRIRVLAVYHTSREPSGWQSRV